jgi:hypothetical protein
MMMTEQKEKPESTTTSYDLAINLHESLFPVIKIDFEGTILYANKAAFGLIREWGCVTSRKLPVNLLNSHPELLDQHANVETEFPVSDGVVKFNVIAFSEAGYTGLYGYDKKITAS